MYVSFAWKIPNTAQTINRLCFRKYSYLYFNIYFKTEYNEALSTARKIQEHVFRVYNWLHELQTLDVNTVVTSVMATEIPCDNEQPLVINRQLRHTW